VVLFTDWTLLRLFPPLRAMWAAIGSQAKVGITGQNARRALFGTFNLRTAHRTVLITRGVGTRAVRAFLRALRRAFGGPARSGSWPTGRAGTRPARRAPSPRSCGSSSSGCPSSGRS
jgi:hypothetical protein